MRSRRYRQKATSSDITAASETKHLPAASQDVSDPQGKPNSVIAGGRMLTMASFSARRCPDQNAWLAATSLYR